MSRKFARNNFETKLLFLLYFVMLTLNFFRSIMDVKVEQSQDHSLEEEHMKVSDNKSHRESLTVIIVFGDSSYCCLIF